MGLLGSMNKVLGGKTKKAPSAPSFGTSEADAARLTAATPAELQMMADLGISAEQADQDMLEQIRALGARGEDLSNVDKAYMERAYAPAYDRLMTDFGQMDQSIIENMNKRGIASVPGGASEPEAYQRSLLARDTKRTLANTMLEAQNQAVQQKLAQYNARLAEPTLATTRYGQTMAPLQNATIVPESERQANKIGAATNLYSSRLGHNAAGFNAQTQKSIANNQNMTNLLGATIGAAGMMSDPAMKKNREAGPDPEQDLAELSDTPIDRWQYRFEPDGGPMHEGAMADEAPADTQIPGGIDVPSYLGKLTNAVKALNNKMSAYERLQVGGA
jgi:hypothetical protein